ncbi:hypothetical protein CDAR_399661 [Caerostris darwini]|uniref:Uncharacterized protein n=1 Tax=Caerostris darwini TaxID=1538125 RepID=A0AAV4P7H2_9ARAC|nr:hypothetical protein CDAR_399661 [Caerostris darwini]
MPSFPAEVSPQKQAKGPTHSSDSTSRHKANFPRSFSHQSWVVGRCNNSPGVDSDNAYWGSGFRRMLINMDFLQKNLLPFLRKPCINIAGSQSVMGILVVGLVG